MVYRFLSRSAGHVCRTPNYGKSAWRPTRAAAPHVESRLDGAICRPRAVQRTLVAFQEKRASLIRTWTKRCTNGRIAMRCPDARREHAALCSKIKKSVPIGHLSGGLRRNATRAPTQVPESRGRLRPTPDFKSDPLIIAYCGRQMVLTMGAALGGQTVYIGKRRSD